MIYKYKLYKEVENFQSMKGDELRESHAEKLRIVQKDLRPKRLSIWMPPLSGEMYDFFFLDRIKIWKHECRWPEIWRTKGARGIALSYISFETRVARGLVLRWTNAKGGKTGGMDGQREEATEINLWMQWTTIDTMTAFNSTLSTSENDLNCDRRDKLLFRYSYREISPLLTFRIEILRLYAM